MMEYMLGAVSWRDGSEPFHEVTAHAMDWVRLAVQERLADFVKWLNDVALKSNMSWNADTMFHVLQEDVSKRLAKESGLTSHVWTVWQHCKVEVLTERNPMRMAIEVHAVLRVTNSAAVWEGARTRNMDA